MAPLPVLLAALALLAPARDGSGSLEAFLKRVRGEREAEFARLRPEVEDLVAKIGQSRGGSELKALEAKLEALGSEAVPLLVPFLDPGASATPEKDKQADEVAVLLARAKSSAVLEELVRMAGSGSPKGRQLAVRVLGESPETERARAALRALHPLVSGTLRAECVRALAHLSSDEPLVVAGLSDPHPEVLAAALRALRTEPRRKPRAEVVALLAEGGRGAEVLGELVDYFSVPGQELDEDMVVALARFACRDELTPEARLKVLDGLPRFGVPLSSRLRRELEPLLTSQDSAIKDAVLIALTLLKDSKARRDLMRFYDDQVRNNPGWALAYQRRGDVELRIGEYRDAARDYQEAIRLQDDSALLPANRELWINLARAYVRDAKLKLAADTLATFGLTTELRRTLKADPDFLPLVESSKYKGLFE